MRPKVQKIVAQSLQGEPKRAITLKGSPKGSQLIYLHGSFGKVVAQDLEMEPKKAVVVLLIRLFWQDGGPKPLKGAHEGHN